MLLNGNVFAKEVLLSEHIEIGKSLYDRSFGRGCGACHEITSNPQLDELIQDGSLNKTDFFETMVNGKGGMPRSEASIMATPAAKESGYSPEQAFDAVYSYLEFLGKDVDSGATVTIEDIKDVEDVTSELDPMPLIRVNNLALIPDEVFLLNSGQELSISIELNPESKIDENADWWVSAYNDTFGWLYFDLTRGWVQIGNSLNNLLPSHQGKLFDLETTVLLNTKRLPLGAYQFYFGVDTSMNGILDDPLYFDNVTVDVVPTGR